LIKVDFVISEIGREDTRAVDLFREIAKTQGPVCILQPHQGKRHAMYTGFAVFIEINVEAMIVTDSDTFLDPNSVKG
jgi:hyaluronan synthase